MKKLLEIRVPRRLGWMNYALVCALGMGSAVAQKPGARITAEVNNAQRATLEGSHTPMARAANDVGRMATGTKLQGMSLGFSRSAAQEQDLQTLLAAQQDPTSPMYHQWLTPDEFAARFGAADADLATAESWLQAQGFSVDRVTRSRNKILFSGSVAQVEAAFGTEMHHFQVDGVTHFAPAGDLTIPAAFAGAVQNVGNLSDFRPKPHMRMQAAQVGANFTSSQSGSHYVTPQDVATIYDINAAYSAGYTGIGQTIAAVGQSAVVLTDIENFQTASGLTVKDPTPVLVPGSGASTVYAGDEAESDLDLEYSGAIAKGAKILFVYTGNNTNYGVFDSIEYAVDERIAPIVSVSYGLCEAGLAATDYTTLNGILAQGAAQGQSVIAASGDAGSTDCNGQTSLTAAQQTGIAVDFPASSQYVTGMGGTEYLTAAVATSNTTYWTAASGSDVISSAKSYMPEMVWNDDLSTAPSSGGGGVSTLTARPSWQTGVTGIPSGSFRLVPDIALASSPVNAGYLYCSSDTDTGITGSCAHGFRDTNTANLTVAGGTSFAAPIFAGMLAIINQKQNSTGQGVVNSTLYTLASNASTYASAFHDITSGTNACPASYSYCSTAAAAVNAAATGYDEATGLGSLDFYNLMNAWPTTTASAMAGTTTTITAATTTPAVGATDLITFQVAPQSSTLTTTPTGTVSLVVDGTAVTTPLTLASGMATYSFTSTASGAHVIKATYSGDATYAASTSTLILGTTSSTGTFSLAAQGLTITAGSSGTSTVTVTPAGGYIGTVAFTVTSSTAIANACYTLTSAPVTGTAAVTTTLKISTSAALCASSAVTGTVGHVLQASAGTARNQAPGTPGTERTEIALAGLMLFGLCGYRSRRMRPLVCVLVLGGVGFALSGCSSSTGSTTTTTTASSTYTAAGTYKLTVVGTDTTSSAIAATTTLTLVVN